MVHRLGNGDIAEGRVRSLSRESEDLADNIPQFLWRYVRGGGEGFALPDDFTRSHDHQGGFQSKISRFVQAQRLFPRDEVRVGGEEQSTFDTVTMVDDDLVNRSNGLFLELSDD